jgi:hypothetical protein
LTGLIRMENAMLASGLPASVSQRVARKARMSAELDVWLARIRAGDEIFTKAEREVHLELVEQLRMLQEVMVENTNRLKHALSVTRCRIEAIMAAMRAQTHSDGVYDRSGARQQVEDRVDSDGIRVA